VVLSRLYRGIQTATEMLPLKRGRGVAHSVIVVTASPAFADMRLADALVNHFVESKDRITNSVL